MYLLLAMLWIIPSAFRTWRLARFYQIEEYMSDRFWRWFIAKMERWLPFEHLFIIGASAIIGIGLQLANIENNAVYFVVFAVAALALSIPEPVKETKKHFNRTPRAMRIIVSAIVVQALFIVGLSVIFASNEQLFPVAIIGMIGFLMSAPALMIGNGLMFPYEESQREGFRRQARSRLAAAKPAVIGITGSYGKTSTKHYLAHILGGRYKVYPTPKSYNTEMGICRAINEDLDPAYGFQYFVAEMGAYVPGEIARIMKLTEPTMSIVTAVGPMHLERFGTIENVAKAKYEIVEGLPKNGTCFFNGDDPQVLAMAKRGYPDNRMIVSRENLSDAHFLAEKVEQSLNGLSFEVVEKATGERHLFKTPLLGIHNVTNILLATAVARHNGLNLVQIAERVALLEPAEHRLNHQVLPSGIVVIDDAYNANPVGAANALEVLKLHQKGRRIVITPGMVELGTLQEEENYKLGQRLTETATDIVLVGIEQTQPLYAGIKSTRFDPSRLLIVDTFDEARLWFQSQVKPNDAVLFLNDLPDTYL